MYGPFTDTVTLIPGAGSKMVHLFVGRRLTQPYTVRRAGLKGRIVVPTTSMKTSVDDSQSLTTWNLAAT